MNRGQCAIVGVGVTPTARIGSAGKSGLLLEAWAARLALEDAGVARSMVDGAVHCMMASPHPPSQWIDTYSRTLGIAPNFYLNIARGGQAAHNGMLLARHLLDVELATVVLVTCGLPGYTATRGADPNSPASASEMTGASMSGFLHHGLGQLGFDAAASSAELHGLYATRHMYEFGTTKEQLGAVTLAAREWANLNPQALLNGKPVPTIDEYLALPDVVWPYNRMDCCVQSDLGVAFVVTTAERARDMNSDPVYVKGIGLGDQAREQWWEQTNYIQVDAGFALRSALREADVELADIDVAEFYDCFSLEPILFAEGYGLCAQGEGGDFVQTGAMGPGGSFPTNTFGGLLAGMYLFDFPGVAEAVYQLRGKCGDRQVQGAAHALTNGHGGEMVIPGMCSSHATMVLGTTA
jgi:acetyl-CoA acetyltransferase